MACKTDDLTYKQLSCWLLAMVVIVFLAFVYQSMQLESLKASIPLKNDSTKVVCIAWEDEYGMINSKCQNYEEFNETIGGNNE